MGVGMWLYAQLVQTKNKQCNYITMLSSAFIWFLFPTPVNSSRDLSSRELYPGVVKIYLVLVKYPAVGVARYCWSVVVLLSEMIETVGDCKFR